MPDHTTNLRVRVTPSSANTRITAFKNGEFWISVAAPPHQGRANEELMVFLAHALAVSKSSLSIRRGEASKTKQIEVFGLTEEEAHKRLAERLS